MGKNIANRTAQATPQGPWIRCGKDRNFVANEYAGADPTPLEIGANGSKVDATAEKFTDSSVDYPWYVIEPPAGNRITMRVALMGTADTTTLGCVTLAYARRGVNQRDSAISPAGFGRLVCALGTDAVALSNNEKARYVPTALQGNDWYWVKTFTADLNAALGGISIIASEPSEFSFDFNGNGYVWVYPNCCTSFADDTRASDAMIVVWSSQ